jgi:hypothetical protein
MQNDDSIFCIHHSSFVKAEEVGFEPTMDCSIPVFKTGAFVHSAIPPNRGSGEPLPSGEHFTTGKRGKQCPPMCALQIVVYFEMMIDKFWNIDNVCIHMHTLFP